jgi:GTP cyclohydrolase I
MANIDLDLDFDFGFTTGSEDDFKQEGNDKAQAMYDAIMPLLKNLQKDADKNPIINWPNRAQKIDQFITRLNKILSS